MGDEKEGGFTRFGLDPALLRAVEELGFETPTPIQDDAMPLLLQGRDVIGGARTGSGKTAAFGLPLLHRVRSGGPVRGLILAPTRELAIQVADALKTFAKHLKIEVLTIYGGTPYPPQLKGLRRGATVVVGTPGRIIDLMKRRALDVSGVEYFVLDEADEMLRMGFIDDVEQVLAALPTKRQVALFSATMPNAIRKVADKYLTDAVQIQVEQKALSVSHITQSYVRVPQREKVNALLRLLAGKPPGATLVFARTRKRCAEVAQFLVNSGIAADALHGDLNQGARERVIGRLRAKALDIVVATDVAARGIDVDHLTHVINFDIPDDTELYVHRIGRTARAGREGTAITLVAPRDRGRAKQIERELKIKIPEARLPSNEQISESRRGEVIERVHRELSKPEIVEVRTWLRGVLKQRGWSAEDVAAAAIHLLGAELNFAFNQEAPAEGPDFAKVNEVEVVLSIGRRDGIRPSDIVGALANDLGIPGNQIGKISLGAHRAFIGLPTDVAEKLLTEHPTIEVRKRKVEIRRNEKHSPTSTSKTAPESRPRFTKKPSTTSPKKPGKGKKVGRSNRNKGKPGRHKKRK